MGDPDDSRIGGSKSPQTGETCPSVPQPVIWMAPQDRACPVARGRAAGETAETADPVRGTSRSEPCAKHDGP